VSRNDHQDASASNKCSFIKHINGYPEWQETKTCERTGWQ